MHNVSTAQSNYTKQTHICQCSLCQRGRTFTEKLKNVNEEDRMFFELLYNDLCDTEVELEMLQVNIEV